MKNIILQHWTGEMNELELASSTNISKYAKNIGADYRLLLGNVFRPNLTPPCQKIYMLDEIFDKYDMVVMLDMDMFVRKGMTENVFEDVQGVGMFTEFQEALFKNMQRKFPKLTNSNYPYWGGAIYRLDRELRQRLRIHIKENELIKFSGNYEDEGIMHRLATLAKVEKSKLPGGFKWCHCSYRDGIEEASMIHIRTKITPDGPKQAKIENYKELIKKGLIEE